MLNVFAFDSLFGIIITLAGTAVAVFLCWYLKEKVDSNKIIKINSTFKKIEQEFFLKQTWAKEAIRYAEQKLWDENGSKKYDEVMTYIASRAKKVGIEITPHEMSVLIESELHKIKTEVSAEWKNIVTSNPVVVTEQPVYVGKPTIVEDNPFK